MSFDPRITPARADLAAAHLKGKVDAPRFVEGEPRVVIDTSAPLRRVPRHDAALATEALYGERVIVYDIDGEGWAWGQIESDGYVGYLPETAIREGAEAPTHVVVPQRTFLYPEPELRKPHAAILSMGSLVRVTGTAEARGNHYVVLEDGRAIFAKHVQPIGDNRGGDFVDVALRFLETPYLWGGRSGLGIDCSGLVQLALSMTGRAAPRDTDMQAAGLGQPIERDELKRGDFAFWKGHVAIMEDPETIVHANGHTMTVARENFDGAIERIGWLYERPTGYRRFID